MLHIAQVYRYIGYDDTHYIRPGGGCSGSTETGEEGPHARCRFQKEVGGEQADSGAGGGGDPLRSPLPSAVPPSPGLAIGGDEGRGSRRHSTRSFRLASHQGRGVGSGMGPGGQPVGARVDGGGSRDARRLATAGGAVRKRRMGAGARAAVANSHAEPVGGLKQPE